MATIRDVARLAAVGTGTVSRVINNRASVDPATRARVLLAIAELDFRPSAVARRLSTGRTGSIGVVAPFMTRPSAVERLRGIEGELSTTGYDMVVFNVETIERRDAVVSDLLRGDRVDGVILLAVTPRPAEVAAIARADLPVVLLDASHPRFDRVVVNDLGGGRLAARHLLELGHRRIAFVGELPRMALNLPASRLRHRGVRAALREAGLDLRPEYTVIGEQGLTHARELAARLFGLAAPPTGIICASDQQALGVMESARANGLDIPGDVSVIGYDDLEIAGYLGLTTIRQPMFESGMRAARMLVARIDRRDGRTDGRAAARPARAVVGVELIRRSSSGPPRT